MLDPYSVYSLSHDYSFIDAKLRRKKGEMRNKTILKTIIMVLAVAGNVLAGFLCWPSSATADVTTQLLLKIMELPKIEIDGDMSDWSDIGPLYVDELGDTQPWSSDTYLLSMGSTAESPGQIPINDEARDLKAVYVYNYTDTIYLRVDVNSLIENWEYPQMNASLYVVAFDTDLTAGSGMYDLAFYGDTNTNLRACWERILCCSSSTSAWIQDTNWNVIDGTWGNIQFAQNVAAGAFEFSIPRTDFPAEWNGTPLAITVASYKPGEWPTSGPNPWLHAFDPQAPGTPGEVWDDPGSWAEGSDVADVIPGGVNGIYISGHVKDFLTVFAPIPRYANVDVDCQESLGLIKSLQGVNDGPLLWNFDYDLSDYYTYIGVNWVRLHDSSGPVGDWFGEWIWAVDIHCVFPDFEANPNQPENYNFTTTDQHIKAIKDMGADIIYRLGYSAGTISDPPADYTKWADICLHIIKHYNDGWADGFHYNITYWEIWNEPDIEPFWTGTAQQYFDLYNVTATGIKNYDSNLKVGGPCIAYRLDFLEGFLSYCKNYNVPLDFVSWHAYGSYGGNPYGMYLTAEAVENLMETYGFSSRESLLTEWNMGVTTFEWDSLRQDPALAAFIASALIYLQNSSTDIANYYRGDSWRWGGLFTSEGSPGKAWYTFRAFKMLLDTPNRVYCSGSDTQGYATIAGVSDDGRTVTVLVSDYGSSVSGYELNVQNLPWGGSSFLYERYVLDEAYNLELAETKSVNGANFSTTEDMQSPSIHLIRLTTVNPADLNDDGIVDILDITIVAKAFDSKPGDLNWNAIADLDNNGIVDIIDITRVATNFDT